MIRNDLSRFGRLLLTVIVVSAVALMAGCCQLCDLDKCCPKLDCKECPAPAIECPPVDTQRTNCETDNMQVVYAFNIPVDDAQCKAANPMWEFVDLKAEQDERDGGADIIDRDGGAGVVPREPRDGGAGIIDREGNKVMQFCDYDPCSQGQVEVQPVLIDLNKSKAAGLVLATNDCVASGEAADE